MKAGKKPTVAQRKIIQKMGLNSENWLVSKDTTSEMLLVHRYTNTTKTIHKEKENDGF